MQTQIQVFKYQDHSVEFDLGGPSLAINATEMAKIFGTDLGQFLRNDSTRAFIKACLDPANSQDLGINKEGDLFAARRGAGTWMHRILALKFAAWLDPYFEVWVYCTINNLLLGQQPVTPTIKAEAEQIKEEKAVAEEEHKEAEKELLGSPLFVKWLKSEQNKKSADAKLRRLAKKVASQVELSFY